MNGRTLPSATNRTGLFYFVLFGLAKLAFNAAVLHGVADVASNGCNNTILLYCLFFSPPFARCEVQSTYNEYHVDVATPAKTRKR